MKKIYIVLAAVSICVGLYGCNDKTASSSDTGSSAEISVVSDNAQVSTPPEASGDGQEQLSTEIAADRLNTDFESLKKASGELFEQYYTGIKQEDYEQCFSVFPDFYKEAVEKETKDLKQTNDQYIVQMNDSFKETYGGDYYAYVTVDAILQLTDISLEEMQTSINKSFGTDIKLEDAYSVYTTQTARGAKNKGSQEYEYFLLKIKSKYYIYDRYYEK